MLFTAMTFFVLRTLKVGPNALKLLSALAFPALLVALIYNVVVWNPEPHGIVAALLASLTAVCLPFTILTTAVLVRRFA